MRQELPQKSTPTEQASVKAENSGYSSMNLYFEFVISLRTVKKLPGCTIGRNHRHKKDSRNSTRIEAVKFR